MPHLFNMISEARRRRKQIKEALSRNAIDFEETLERIHQKYRNQNADIMNEYIHNVLVAGDIDAQKTDELTEEAERKCEELKAEEEREITEAFNNNERRIRQILKWYH